MRDRRPHYYKLIGKLPVPCGDPLEWGVWFESADRHVAKTDVGPLLVSTVFLGLDHSLFDDTDPILFETMIFYEGEDEYQTRCSTWDEAEQQHKEAVRFAERRVAKAKGALQALERIQEPQTNSEGKPTE